MNSRIMTLCCMQLLCLTDRDFTVCRMWLVGQSAFSRILVELMVKKLHRLFVVGQVSHFLLPQQW